MTKAIRIRHLPSINKLSSSTILTALMIALRLSSFVLVSDAAAIKKTVATSKPPAISAAKLYRLSLKSNEVYTYSARQFVTSWRDDGSAVASVAKIDHLAPNLDRITYSAPRSRSGVTIISDDGTHQEWIYLPQRKIIVHSVTTPGATPNSGSELALLETNYRLVVGVKPVLIAGRKAFTLQLVRRRPGRPYEHLWIDPNTGIVLRREKFSSDGTIVSITYLDQLNMHSSLKTADFTTTPWLAKRPQMVEKTSTPEQPVNATILPSPFKSEVKIAQSLDGYSLVNATILRRLGKDSLHLLYSDGLYPISLYATPRRSTKPTKMAGSHQVLLAPHEIARTLQQYSYWLVNWDCPGMTYTAAGDTNLASVLQVARLQYLATVPPSQAKSSRSFR